MGGGNIKLHGSLDGPLIIPIPYRNRQDWGPLSARKANFIYSR